MHRAAKISLEDFGTFKGKQTLFFPYNHSHNRAYLVDCRQKDAFFDQRRNQRRMLLFKYLSSGTNFTYIFSSPVITDMKTVWYRKGDKDMVLSEKRQFNPAINTTSLKGIFELLEPPISSFDKQAEYKFQFEVPVLEGLSL